MSLRGRLIGYAQAFERFLELGRRSPSEARRLRVVVVASLATCLSTLLMGSYIYAQEGLSLPVKLCIGIVPLSLIDVLAPRWSRRDGDRGLALCTLVFAGLCLTTHLDPKPASAAVTVWYAVLPLFASVIIGPRFAMLMAGLSLANLIYFMVATASLAPLAQNYRFWPNLFNANVLIVVAALAWFYESTRRRHVQEEERLHRKDKERLQQEVEIARQIQMSILPQEMNVAGLEIAAEMIPASEVGGDYFDVFPVKDGCWIGVGDVSGHGLPAGLIMLMIQSVVAALGRQAPDCAPREIVARLNQVLYDNIRRRLKQDDHATFALIRYRDDGSLVFAGAHEEIVIWRARTQRCELVDTPGTWVGAMEDVRDHVVDSRCQLEPGDVVMLYTDGIVEARNAGRQQFGVERLCAALEQALAASADRPPAEVRDHVLAAVRAWMPVPDDDVTLLVLRHKGLALSARAA